MLLIICGVCTPAGRDLSAHPLLRALADRELPVRRGMLATIVFLRCTNARGQVRLRRRSNIPEHEVGSACRIAARCR